MSKPMKIGGYLIVQLEGQLTVDEAFSELIDNTLDAGASCVNIVFTKRMMSISDNGHGTDDPNLIATPSMSRSRNKRSAIGSKAIGAKQACAKFGRTWDIQTVLKGKNQYRRYQVAWDESGPLPDQYDGSPMPARSAPSEIRNGGTKVTVTGRRDGFPSVRLEATCKSLESTYRPALSSGKFRVTVQNPEVNFTYQLQDQATDERLFAGAVLSAEGEAAGRKFAVRYGALKEHHKVLSYCHVIYGPRVIQTVNSIGRQTLPAGCYIDVTLSSDWKDSLSTNKTSVARYRDDLMRALETMLTEWIQKQKEEAAAFRMQVVSGAVSDLLNEAIDYLDEGAGEHQQKPAEERVGTIDTDDDEDDGSDPSDKKRNQVRRKRAVVGGNVASIRDRSRRSAKLIIRSDPTLAQLLYRVAYVSGGDNIEIALNTGPHQREIVEYFNQSKLNDLYKVAVLAFAQHVAENKMQFSGIFKSLRRHGYEIDPSDQPYEIVARVSNFLIDAAYDLRGSIKRAAA